jgi:hypothetical protein
MLLVIVVGLVFFSYYGGDNCPKILKDNKKVLLGLLIGLFMCKFMSRYLIVEGLDDSPNVTSIQCPQGKGFYFTEKEQLERGPQETDVELAIKLWYAQGAGSDAVENICRVGGQASGCPAGNIRARGEESLEKCSPCGQIEHTRHYRVWDEPINPPHVSVTEYKDKIDKVPNPEGTECICPTGTRLEGDRYLSCVDNDVEAGVKVEFEYPPKNYPVCPPNSYENGGSCTNNSHWGYIEKEDGKQPKALGGTFREDCVCFGH